MKGLIIDIETNGFLADLTKVHCLAVREADVSDGGIKVFGGVTDEKIRNVLSFLEDAPCLIGHNIMEFDIPAIQKVYPSFKPRGTKFDTLLASQLIWTDLFDQDMGFRRKNPDFPGNLMGRHKLKAWGYRLGVLKGKMEDADGEKWYEKWTPELEAYCVQDVRVTKALLDLIESKNYSQQALDIEHEFKEYILDQERDGLPFDEEGAKALYAALAAERATLEAELTKVFPPWQAKPIAFTPKRDNVKKGYVAGQVFLKPGKTVTFNPRSHDHIAQRLQVQREWKPEEFTEGGKAETNGDILEVLGKKWPECQLLARHGEIQKIIGMVAEGKTSYLKMVKNGRIHGRVITNGAVTGRCSHKEPNLANIPRRSALGTRVRKLFTAVPGYSLVGSDAKGLEIRMLAHYLAKYDDGAYAEIAVAGDPHVFHQGLAGLPTKDNAKTFFYGWLYGAGNAKIGLIVGKGEYAGKALKDKFLKRFPALNALKNAVSAVAKQRGFLVGLDGRKLRVRAVYSSLNTLLQSAGAITVKVWTILFNRELRKRGLFQAGHARQVVHCHDEYQVLVRNGYEEEVSAIAKQTMREAGEYFKLRCRTDADSKTGANWGETH